MTVQTSPKEIRRTLDSAITTQSRAGLLRLIDRLHRQYEAKLAKTITNERREAYQLAKARRTPETTLGIFRQRWVESETKRRANDTSSGR